MGSAAEPYGVYEMSLSRAYVSMILTMWSLGQDFFTPE